MEGEFYNLSTLATKRKDEEMLTENVPAKRRKTVPASYVDDGKIKLKELRVRMERERNWVIEVMDRRKLDDILVDWQPWWQNAWVWSGGKQAEEENSKKEKQTRKRNTVAC